MDSREISLRKYTQYHIHRYYPEEKQKSDQVDWLFHTTLLSTKTSLTVHDIAKLVYQSVAKILENQSTLEDEVKHLSEQYSYADSWEQLLKVGIRVTWLQTIKSKFRYILNSKIPEEELYYVVRKEYPKLEL